MEEGHAVATAALVREGRLLLAHRHPRRRWYPDCWDLVGGHLEPGESPLEAVRRECREEIGVHVADPVPMPFEITGPGLELHAFLVTDWTGEPANLAPDEHDDLRWFTREEVPGLVLAHAAALPDLLGALEAAAARRRAEHRRSAGARPSATRVLTCP